jgi:hypothetical protein
MKPFIFSIIFAVAFSSLAQPPPLEKFCPHFSTNAPITWEAPTNDLPKNFWIYRRLPPRPFSRAVISNAVVLASLQNKGFPKPSTKDFYIAEDRPANYPGPIPVIFGIYPKSATISYWMPHPDTNTAYIPADEIIVKRAWECAGALGVDSSQVIFKGMTSDFNRDKSYNDLTNQLSGRGVYLARRLDGIAFTDRGDNGANGGFWIEFGSRQTIRAFSLVWPELKRDRLLPIAGPQQIIACIRAFKAMSPPSRGETNYFMRLKVLAKAEKIIITKITPAYSEGVYGQAPTNDEPSKLITPFAELEAIATFGNSSMAVRLYTPIISSDVARLLTQKTP